MNIVFADQGYKLCSSVYPPGGNDSCYDCPPGTFNHLPTDTSEILNTFFQEKQCRKFDCDCAPGKTRRRERLSNSFKRKLCSLTKGDNYENDKKRDELYFTARSPLFISYQFCIPLMWPSFSFCLVSLSCINKCVVNDIKRN